MLYIGVRRVAVDLTLGLMVDFVCNNVVYVGLVFVADLVSFDVVMLLIVLVLFAL